MSAPIFSMPPTWNFLTHHARVLMAIARRPDARLRDLADEAGITERAVQRIVRDLEDAGYLARERDGRRNHYEVNRDAPLAEQLGQGTTVAALLALDAELDDSGHPVPESPLRPPAHGQPRGPRLGRADSFLD